MHLFLPTTAGLAWWLHGAAEVGSFKNKTQLGPFFTKIIKTDFSQLSKSTQWISLQAFQVPRYQYPRYQYIPILVLWYQDNTPVTQSPSVVFKDGKIIRRYFYCNICHQQLMATEVLFLEHEWCFSMMHSSGSPTRVYSSWSFWRCWKIYLIYAWTF